MPIVPVEGVPRALHRDSSCRLVFEAAYFCEVTLFHVNPHPEKFVTWRIEEPPM